MKINSFDEFKSVMNNHKSFTVKRGNDGFGSQMYATIIGYCISRQIDKPYYYSNLSPISLVAVSLQSNSTERANVVLNKIMKNLNITNVAGNSDGCLSIQLPYGCTNDQTFSAKTLSELHSSWPLPRPSYFGNDHIISIHIRRGLDIIKKDKHRLSRWVEDPNFYKDMVYKLFNKYPKSKIHIFCWGECGLEDVKNDNLIIHNSDGNAFIEDFNAFVHSDMLVVAGSTFSVSAAFFNKNTILCSSKILKFTSLAKERCYSSPFPEIWEQNYNSILEQ